MCDFCEQFCAKLSANNATEMNTFLFAGRRKEVLLATSPQIGGVIKNYRFALFASLSVLRRLKFGRKKCARNAQLFETHLQEELAKEALIVASSDLFERFLGALAEL